MESLEDPSIADTDSLASSLERLSDSLARDDRDSVPLVLPEREDLAMVLLPADRMHQLDELRGDETRLQGLFLLFLGGLLGFLGSFATSDVGVDRRLVVICALMILVTAIFGFLYRSARTKSAKAREELIGGT